MFFFMVREFINIFGGKNIDRYKREEFKIVQYDIDKIYEDCLKECYKKDIKEYELKYYEYRISVLKNNRYAIYNAKKHTVTYIEDYICDKIIPDNSSCMFLNPKNNININIVDEILSSFIDCDTKNKFKNFAYNVIVQPTDKEIIFNDDECGILQSIFNSLMVNLYNLNYFD